jgi:hypothetical protein
MSEWSLERSRTTSYQLNMPFGVKTLSTNEKTAPNIHFTGR